MNILAIETTGATASVAIIDEKGRIFEEASTEKLNHLQFLMPMVGKVLEKSQLVIGDLTAIAASEGPGSFTGIRIGVSSARALSQALDVRCISVPTLKSFAYNVPEYKGIFCPIFDARRSQIYGGAYSWKEDGTIDELIKGNAYTIDEFLGLLQELLENAEHSTNSNNNAIFFGDGVEAYGTQIEKWQNSSLKDDTRIDFAPSEVRYQKSSSIAQLALELYKKGQLCCYSELEPNYMRKAEAERKLDEANAAERTKR